jgi:PAS domain S-box-containing protein
MERLSVLIVEDSPSDAALMVRRLTEAGFDVEPAVVDDAGALRAALLTGPWDVILADFSLPGFDAREALEIVRQAGMDVPFIVVSGVIGDERAIELMRLGAKDYVLKDNLVRLGAAVRREVEDARGRARHRAAEDALLLSEGQQALLASALDSAATPVAICDGDGAIEWLNSEFAACSGFTAAESLGRNLRSLLDSGKNAAGLRAAQSRKLRTGLSWSGEMILRRKDGSVFPGQVTLTPARDASGAVKHFTAILHDLTEQRRQEERLMESQRLEAIGQLTGGIAHDFNNLLTVIIGNAELLGEQLHGNRGLAELAGMITTAAGRGADLTRALLAFARKQVLAPQVVDVNRLLMDMRPLLRRTLGEHIEVRVMTQPGLAPALIDAAQLEGALLNLCINARDAVGTGGRMVIETADRHLDLEQARPDLEIEPGNYVMVAVSDSGCGIAPENLSRVFEPFFTTKGSGKGTGLGLSRVYGFIRQSGGHISLSSVPDEGTTVKLYLPRADSR